MRFIHVIFAIDAIVVLAFLFLFLNGISIASIFSFSTGIWWALVVGVPVIFASSVILDQHGFHRMAVGLLLILTSLAIALLSFMVSIVGSLISDTIEVIFHGIRAIWPSSQN